MAVIVGAACQPLQPEAANTGSAVSKSEVSSAAGPDTRRQALPGAALEQPAPAATAIPALPSSVVALVLPLSGRHQALGTAVRDGFIAAHLEAPGNVAFEIVIIDEASTGIADAHLQALKAGARVMVGPLLKESVQAIAPLADQLADQMQVLALNNLSDSDLGFGGLWQFGLAPEDEARQAAGRAIALGQRRALALVPASEWGQRLLAAFSDEFTALGGVMVETRTYLPGSPDYSAPIRSLLQTFDPASVSTVAVNPGEKPVLAPRRRQDADLIFLASNRSNSRQLVPQLKFFGGGDLPTYTTSAIWEDGDTNMTDLNGVIFADSPWVISPASRDTLVKKGVVRYWGPEALGASRLYALGYDAWLLVPHILRQSGPGPFRAGVVPGTTGTLYADGAGRIHRQLSFAEIRNGQPAGLPPVTQATGF